MAPHDIGSSVQMNWNALPASWTWERFKVIDAGGGMIGLHNAIHNRFVQMNHADMSITGHRHFNHLPPTWAWEKFRPVLVVKASA